MHRWLILLMLLGGCAEPITNRLTDKMDRWFDSLGQPTLSVNSALITGPGYAPAYPPFDPSAHQAVGQR
jgi:hypothetical protein